MESRERVGVLRISLLEDGWLIDRSLPVAKEAFFEVKCRHRTGG